MYVHLLLSAHEKYKRSGVCLLGGGEGAIGCVEYY